MVKKALRNLGGSSSVFLKKQNTILSAAAILSLASGANTFLGLVKSRLLTYYFGVSDELSVFYTADKIPNLVYSILVVGALSTVFIPIFSELLEKNKEEAWDAASSMLNAILAVFFVFGSGIFIFAPLIIKILSVNKFSTADIALGSNLMRIMLGAQLILVISSSITGILHSFKYFLIPALAPVLYNLGMLFGTVFFSSTFGIYGPAIGVILGAFLHLCIQLPLLKRVGFSYSFLLSLKNASVVKAFSLMPPRILSVLIANVISTINNSLAILVSTPSVVVLKFASQLQFFPVNLFGVSIASALLPTLSKESCRRDLEEFKKIFLTSVHQTLFLVTPASVVLLVLRVPVVRLVYGVSKFPWEATVQTSYTLAFFSISIFAQSVIYLLTRAFYSLKDTYTPVKVSLFTVVINVAISLFFIKILKFGVWSIALSYSLLAFLDMFILLCLLYKKVGGFNLDVLVLPFIKISYSALFMGLSIYLPLKLLDEYVLDTTRTLGLLLLTFTVTLVGIISYLGFTKLFKVEEISLFYKLLCKFKLASGVVTAAKLEEPPLY